MRVPADKKATVLRASQLFPEVCAQFKGPRGGVFDGRAEAALIALFAAMELGRTPTAAIKSWEIDLKKLLKRRVFRMDDEDWDDDDESGPSGEGSLDSNVTGPSIAPMFTGLLGPYGNPIIRHPVLTKMGFHPEMNKYHTPTADEEYPGEGAVVGWVYEV